MGEPAERSPQGSRPPPDDLYRTPLYAQLYPPLGYTPDGRPVFVPGQPSGPDPTLEQRDEVVPTPADDGDVPDETSRRLASSDRRLVGVLALVAVAALSLLAVTVGRAALRDDEPPTAQPDMPVVISELPTRMPTAAPDDEPDTPGAPGGQTLPIGKAVIYEVTTSSPATILYVDDNGLRTTVDDSTKWTITFTGSANPLRVLVLAGQGAATCAITVDGRTVATDRIAAESPRRTVSCRA
ncbi:hypothetical protein [Gordonia insulae]|uniref:Uncharacterized protein n=1 Tax=Gordonia insulae TaxID=2420509 RepID=A0A3G8JNR3_9ACTN|nr:hypothetical protein [Gordonia insulae]AZG46744.1 hypothetical protein D7316_03346 [Gordonia insulae]